MIRRLLRWGLNAAAVLSLVFCVAMAGRWLRSHYVAEQIIRYDNWGDDGEPGAPFVIHRREAHLYSGEGALVLRVAETSQKAQRE